MKHELAKTLTLALVNYIDENRPEGTMDCSSAECKSIEEMFEGDQFDIIEAFIQKKLTQLTEFQDAVRVIITKELTTHTKDGNGREMSCTVFIDDDTAILLAAELLDLAKNELARRDEVITLDNLPPYDKGFQDGKAEAMADLERAFECNPDKLPKWLKDRIDGIKFKAFIRGCNKGYKDAEKQYNESVAYHFPIMPTPPSGWGCDGTHCTNPQMDCINCPRRTARSKKQKRKLNNIKERISYETRRQRVAYWRYSMVP